MKSKALSVPRLRFPEFRDAGDWQIEFGNEVFKQISDKEHDSDLPVLAITQEHGAVPRELIDYHVSVSPKSIAGYKVVKKNDFIISLRSFQGGIEHSNYHGICSPAYVVLRSLKTISIDYFRHYLKNAEFIRLLNVNLAGLRDGKMISYKQFSEIPIPTPREPEQQKIAECLTSIDDLITAEAQKLDALETHKKGLMQQLFPADGETMPKLRFPGFKGAWEVKPLGDCLDYIQPTKHLVKSTAYNDEYRTPVLTAGKTFILGYTNEIQGIFADGLPVIIFDDFTTASKFVEFPFKAKSSAMKILVAKKDANIKFIYEAMQIIKYTVGVHERHWISIFTKLNIAIPKISEQQKITACLTSIDDLITANTQELNALKTHKKGLMQQLFPTAV